MKINDTFKVTLDGDILTHLTLCPNNVLRFPINTLSVWLCDNIKSPCQDERYDGLNALSIAYQYGKFSLKDYIKFYIGLGISLQCFEEMDAFEDVEIWFHEVTPEMRKKFDL